MINPFNAYSATYYDGTSQPLFMSERCMFACVYLCVCLCRVGWFSSSGAVCSSFQELHIYTGNLYGP